MTSPWNNFHDLWLYSSSIDIGVAENAVLLRIDPTYQSQLQGANVDMYLQIWQMKISNGHRFTFLATYFCTCFSCYDVVLFCFSRMQGIWKNSISDNGYMETILYVKIRNEREVEMILVNTFLFFFGSLQLWFIFLP